MNELMTGFLGTGRNPLSRMTVAALQDLGYEVNYDAAEPTHSGRDGSSPSGAVRPPRTVWRRRPAHAPPPAGHSAR